MTETQILYVVLAGVAVFDVLWVGIRWWQRKVRSQKEWARFQALSHGIQEERTGPIESGRFTRHAVTGLELGDYVSGQGPIIDGLEGFIIRRSAEPGIGVFELIMEAQDGSHWRGSPDTVIKVEPPAQAVQAIKARRTYTREGVTVQEPPPLCSAPEPEPSE